MTTAAATEKRNSTSMLYSKYETSETAERDGLWYVPPNCVGEKNAPQFLLARYGGEHNELFNKAMEGISRTERKAIEDRSLSKGKSREIAVESFVAASLLDWKNVFGKDGKELAFSKESAKKIMFDLPDLFSELLDASSDRGLYIKEGLEVDVKN